MPKFKNITKKVLSEIYNYYYENRLFHDLEGLLLPLSQFDDIEDAINLCENDTEIGINFDGGFVLIKKRQIQHQPYQINVILQYHNCL